MTDRLLLAIETSCDETAAAVVTDKLQVRSSVVWSQIELHQEFGGVVPEVASRAHLDAIDVVIPRALEEAGVSPADLKGIAVTRGPGLNGPLLVGVSAAKALGLAWGLPVVGVNHLVGHLMSAYLDRPTEPAYPAVMLLVSGGHCLLAELGGPGSYRVMGGTVDDSVGEAYDKIARYLGLGYPGGPIVDRLAAGAAPATRLPRPMIDDGLDFSFSGLKTATIRYARRNPTVGVDAISAAFVDACMEVLVTKSERALRLVDGRSFIVVGGVAASPILRERVEAMCERASVELMVPPQAYATDNAAMIGAAGWYYLDTFGPSDPGFGAEPSLRFPDW
ncbi:MAG: tRNA (adenosine(37)-N6)-threonylcarbamoyltransferase complex transferase subunit TsaD [Acidimicrobiales bacterium]